MPNLYKNKVVYGNTTLIDISDTTAAASDVAAGKYFYLASGQKVEGTSSGGALQSKTVSPSTSQIVVEPDTGYDGLSSVTVNAIKLQEKSVTPSASEQIITPDKITYDYNIPSGTQNSGVTGTTTLRWDGITSTLRTDGTEYDWEGEITASDGTVITISGTYVHNYATTISTYTVTGPSAVSAVIAAGTSFYIQFSEVAPTSGTVTKAVLAHPHGQEDYDGLSKVTVAAVVPTSSSYTLLGSHEFTVNTTSTSAASIGTFTVPTTVWTKDKAIYIRIRDKAGKRAGYFYGTDNWFINLNVATSVASAFSSGLRYIRRYSTSSAFSQYYGSGTTGYGVYAYSIAKDGTITVYSRYSSSYSLTINGTYVVEVYLLDMPGGISPFA